MIRTATLALAVAGGLALAAAPAAAADLVVYDDDLPMTDVGTVYSGWDGAYVGGFAGFYPNDPSYYFGAQFGFNFLASESFLIGVQLSGLVSPNGGYAEAWLDGKAGFAMDSVAIYGIGGLGIQDDGDVLWRFGVGGEFMVTESLGLFAEGYLSEDIGDLPDVPGVAAGLRFHF